MQLILSGPRQGVKSIFVPYALLNLAILRLQFFFYLATTFAPILQSLKGKSRLETKIPEEYLAYILYPTKGAVV